jgi:N-dimethylarginine dimethylaminohydrolase
MCDPKYFNVEYSINPWMKPEKGVNKIVAVKQWKNVRNKLEELGASVVEVDPAPGLPDMVFAANAGIVHKGEVVISNFRHRERRPEHRAFKKWFLNNGYIVHTLPGYFTFEGRGDCFVWEDYLIGAWGFRSDEDVIQHTADLLGLKPITLKLKDPRFYHLDTCMSVLKSAGFGLYYPGAFWPEEISKLPFDLLPVSEEDAKNFVCNNINVGSDIIMTQPSQALQDGLEAEAFHIHPVNTGEFIKSGGSARCMVLEV